MSDSLVPARTAVTTGDIAVSPHELATQAALEIMAAGGNAIDGAVALNAVMGVVAPDTCGVGGDLFALVWQPEMGTPAALNSSGRAGHGADASVLSSEGLASIPAGDPHSVTVPGCVDGWEALLARFGTMPLARILEPAIRIAGGFPVSTELSASLHRLQPRLEDQASAFELYPDGRTPRAGEVITRPALESTLRELAAGGRSAFYAGRAGAAMTEATRGILTAYDLATPQADWIEPLGLPLFGRVAWTIPPNSQGYLTLATLGIFERLEAPREMTSEYVHLLIEAYRSVAWERDLLLGDPDFMKMKPADLVAPDRLASAAAGVDLLQAGSWPGPDHIDGGTAYMCTADRHGTAVSLIQSNFHGIGSGISAGDTGVWLHNRGAGFSLVAGHPNELAPGKRPLHTLAPTLWTSDGRWELILGTRGGHQQPQLLAQWAAHHFYLGSSIAAAQAAPRWTMTEFGAGTRSRVNVENRVPDRIVAELRHRGHVVTVTERSWEPGWGPISSIRNDGGTKHGAADPRISTAAAAGR